jgi:hypothetical protein
MTAKCHFDVLPAIGNVVHRRFSWLLGYTELGCLGKERERIENEADARVEIIPIRFSVSKKKYGSWHLFNTYNILFIYLITSIFYKFNLRV